MKRSELFFDAILLPLDYLALLAAGMAAYYIRLHPAVQNIRRAQFILELPFVQYVQLVSIVAVIVIIIFSLQGLYAVQARRRAWDEVTRIFSGISMGVMLIILYTFLSAELFQSRFIVIAAYGFALIFVSISRFIIRWVQRLAVRQGYGVYRVLLVGNGQYGYQLAAAIRQRPQLGYRVVGELDTVDLGQMEFIHQTRGIDEVIQTDPTLGDERNLQILDFCDHYKIDYKYVPNLFETQVTNVRFRLLQGVPVVELRRTPLDGWGRIAKRSMDLVAAVAGLLLLAPLFLVVAILIKLDSKGPVFYHQTRVGKNKIPFEIYKFRSMKLEYCLGPAFGGPGAEAFYEALRQQTNERENGPLFKMRQDPRLTRVGRFIRQWRIDELPQLFNVLGGQMSLLGPRPHLPVEVENYSKHHRKLFTIKPGMSGMAQVQGSSGLSFEEEAKLDIGYIENWSLKTDIILLFKTAKILFTDPNAV